MKTRFFNQPFTIRSTLAIAAALTAPACGPTDEASEVLTDEPTGQVTQAIGSLGFIPQHGMIAYFDVVPSNVNFANVTALAACDSKSLYVIVPDAHPFSLHYSTDGGVTFTDTGADAWSNEIACDGSTVYTLDSTRRVRRAPRGGRSLGAWSVGQAAPLVDRIQGGDGTVYGVDEAPGLHPLYKATPKDGDVSWTFVSNIGSKYVTGGGSSEERNTTAWPRRAFTTEPNGTIAFNDTILDGENWWGTLETGSERFSVVSAGATNVLYGIDTTRGPGLVTITLVEDALYSNGCFDNVDNDADGKRDAEDPDCAAAQATAFCQRPETLDGTYCVDRYQPSWFLNQANQNAGLVRCQNHQVVNSGSPPRAVQPGSCVRVGTRSDRLMSQSEISGSDPPNTGRWCNRFSNGLSRFSFGGTDPCGTSTSTIMRAGLYSTNGENNAHIKCTNGQEQLFRGTGTTPLQSLANSSLLNVQNNVCLITVSPANIPMFSRTFPLELQGWTRPFQHAAYGPVPLPQFGLGQTGTSNMIDLTGRQNAQAGHPAYDINLPEGTPLYAMRNGKVIGPNGAREREVSAFGCQTSYQGEIYVDYSIGSNSTYRESFAVYYAHVRQALVEPGQIVRAGQILGYVGDNGCSSNPHLHIGTHRTSNINGHKTGSTANWRFGWHVTMRVENGAEFGSGNNMEGTIDVDPLGWTNAAAPDPTGYVWRNTASTDPQIDFIGLGAWSANLFAPGEAFRFQ